MRWPTTTSTWLLASASLGLLMLPMATCQPNNDHGHSSSNYNESLTVTPLDEHGIWMDNFEPQFASMEELEAHLMETGEIQPQHERELQSQNERELNAAAILAAQHAAAVAAAQAAAAAAAAAQQAQQQAAQQAAAAAAAAQAAAARAAVENAFFNAMPYYELRVPNPDPLIDISKAGYHASWSGVQSVHLSGHTWTSANTKHAIIRAGAGTPPTATAPLSCAVGSTSQPYITVDLGKGNDCFVSGVIIYNAVNQEYCGVRVDLSVDNVNWKNVYDAGTLYSPSQQASGNEVRFYRKRARYIRVYTGRNKNNQNVAFKKLEIKGLSKRNSVRVAVSENGKYGMTSSKWTTAHGTHTFNPMKANGKYQNFAGVTSYVAMTNQNQLFSIVGAGHDLHSTKNGHWKNLGCCIETFASSADGTVAVGIASNLSIWFKTLLNAATNHWSGYQHVSGGLTHAAINGDGTILFGVNKAYAPKVIFGNIINGAKNNWARAWLGFNLPAGMGNAIELSIGGQHELWVIDEHYELYHAWITRTGNSLSVNNWQKMNLQILTITATSSGALWGTAMNGFGVIYCRGRRVNNFARKCEYIPGPYGEFADTS